MESRSRGRAAALAAVVAGTLITGTASAGSLPARAADSAGHNGTEATASAAGTAAVTLVTGDRVVVGGDGRVVQLVRGRGREGTAFSVRREDGHVYVVPQDALRLIGDGVVDRRLFDVAELVRDGYDDAHRAALPVIVGYRRDAAGTAAFDAARDTFAGVGRDRRPLPAVDGEAFDVPKTAATSLWTAVTGPAVTGRATVRAAGAAAAPVAHLWLDGRVRTALDTSVPQIGAPVMWKAGYTGKGVRVAILDSGIDQNHPDLKGLVTAQKNFSSSPDAQDRDGHGTHVASTVAGSGALSGGRYKGVAPDVRLLNGKVIGDDGFGSDSSIVSGMQWAVDQGAKVVNMSIGAGDDPGVDPKEDAVARLSGRALFVVSAGNDGDKAGTINSPGSAPAALTVGAVDKQDRLADFSGRGPTVDGVSKPDITAPGVDITAAATTQGPEPSGDGYVTMSGTSMAAPHVAGAAALLLQQHPDWSGARIKALLTGSAKPDPALNAHQQGAGRVDLSRAATAFVVSEPGSLDFGTQSWPHTDDKPVLRSLTYRNYGAEAVTLQLSAVGADPAGGPAPAGTFTVKDARLTVPAGGSATTSVAADTRIGTVDGAFGGTVLAAGGGQSVRTGLSVVREVESYDVTVRHLDVRGASPATYSTTLTTVGESPQERVELPFSADGTVVQRLPRGDYLLEGLVIDADGGVAVFVQPVLRLTADTAVTLDARRARPFAVTAPDPAARLVGATVGYEDQAAGVTDSWFTDGGAQLRTAALGAADPTLRAQFSGLWKTPGAAGRNVDYRLAFHRTGRFYTGLTATVTRAQVARVRLGFGASVTGAKALIAATPLNPDGFTAGAQDPVPQSAPLSGTQYVSTAGVRWSWSAAQVDAQGEARIIYTKDAVAYRPARRYTLDFNTGVVGPDLAAGGEQTAVRYGDSIDARVQLFNDGSGHSGQSVLTGGHARLESGGRILAEGSGADLLSAEVPAASAGYRLSVAASRAAADTSTSTRVAAVWTFTSARPPADRTVALPLSTVRLAPKLSLRGTAPAGGTLKIPLRLGGTAAAAGQVAALTVRVSYDGGVNWRSLPVRTDAKGARSVRVRNPATAGAASFRVDLKDRSGNTVRETITDAYRLAR